MIAVDQVLPCRSGRDHGEGEGGVAADVVVELGVDVDGVGLGRLPVGHVLVVSMEWSASGRSTESGAACHSTAAQSQGRFRTAMAS